MDLFLECPGSAQGALCPSEVTFCLSNPNSETIAQLSLRSTHAGRAGKAGLSRLYSPSEQGCRRCRQTDDGLPGRLVVDFWPCGLCRRSVILAGCRNSIRFLLSTSMEKEIFLDAASFYRF